MYPIIGLEVRLSIRVAEFPSDLLDGLTACSKSGKSLLPAETSCLLLSLDVFFISFFDQSRTGPKEHI